MIQISHFCPVYIGDNQFCHLYGLNSLSAIALHLISVVELVATSGLKCWLKYLDFPHQNTSIVLLTYLLYWNTQKCV